jgi:CheY-like chemotaxis protein
LAYSSDSIVTRNTAAPVSGWLFASASLSGTEDESGSNPNPEKAQLSSSPSPGTRPETWPQKLNLLLAEDNLPDALLVREAIRQENLPVEVFVASDGERAIDFLEKSEEDSEAPSPHLVILDLNLPKIDGFEVLRRIRASEKHRHIPVIIMTSSDSPADRSEGAQLGAAYFRKPPNYREFLKIGPTLKRFLEGNGLL